MGAFETIAMRLALCEARRFRGATAPNPPVGAVGLTAQGRILCVRAHERAGEAHAEAKIIAECEARGQLAKLHTLVVTLEPCNHHGRTPPCTEAIIRAGVKRVVYGVADENPRVQGGGARRLREAGIEVLALRELVDELDVESADEAAELLAGCEELVAPFFHWVRTGLPWVTVKTAFDSFGSMLPPAGEKTFTSAESLRFAHELRRRSDAILTGSGTVLSDSPLFTVRNVEDHPGKKRWLVVLDRRGRVPSDWMSERSEKFEVLRETHDDGISHALKFLGEKGVHEILVEGGPSVASAFLEHGLWNEHYMIRSGFPDRIERRTRIPDGRATEHVHGHH